MIQTIDRECLQEAVALVNRVFSEFVAPGYSEEGQKTFRDYVGHKYDELDADLLTGHKKMWGWFENGALLGVIATRDVSHISLLFVDKAHHRQGIARTLFQTVREEIQKAGISEITVNSSPYAVEVYKRLGFAATGPEQEQNGIRFVPMKASL